MRLPAFVPKRLPPLLAALAIAAACVSTGPTGPAVVTAPEPPPGTTAPRTGPAPQAPGIVALPNREGSLKFAVLGDFGNGSTAQYEMGEEMARLHERFPFELVITVGDNLYGGQQPQDFVRKFEQPYAALIKDGVKFYASLGNHDQREVQRRYKLFNMDDKLYYSFKAPHQDVRFFALDSTYPTPEQIQWLEKELSGAGEAWKIPYFHHPLYSSAGRHGSSPQLRQSLEPLFIKYGVSVVFAGHDHVYERIKPQHGIVYFVTGSGGQLRRGDLERSDLTAAGFDTDRAFLAAEIIGDELYFNAVARDGRVVDSGIIQRRQPVPTSTGPISPSRPRTPPGSAAPAARP